jgi:hypothetical protein
MRAPWNASWTGEDRYEVRPCRYADNRLALWQPFKPGEGSPMFARPHAVRQRRSIAEGRCTVCGEPTQEGSRVFFPRGAWVLERGTVFWATTEAPVHAFCAELALKVCPVLRAAGKPAIPFPEKPVVLASMIGGPAVLSDFGLSVPAERPIIGHLKLAYPLARAIMFAEAPKSAAEIADQL